MIGARLLLGALSLLLLIVTSLKQYKPVLYHSASCINLPKHCDQKCKLDEGMSVWLTGPFLLHERSARRNVTHGENLCISPHCAD